MQRKRVFHGVCALSIAVAATAATTPSRAAGASWEDRAKQEYPVWSRLCPSTLQNFAADGKSSSGLDGAKFVLKNHPNSDYADDAALIAAALQWDIRSPATAQGLVDVIARHDGGKYVVGDPVWQRYAPRLVRRQADASVAVEGLEADPWTTPALVNAYFAHLDAHPNFTGDEARLKLAEYHLRAGDTAAALAQADAILMKYPDAARTNADVAAADQTDGALIAEILRTEERALLFKVALHYRTTQNYDACLEAASRYVAIYPDRPYGRYVQMIRAMILEERNDLKGAVEAYRAAVNLLERHWRVSTCNNLPIEMCVRPTFEQLVSRRARLESRLDQRK